MKISLIGCGNVGATFASLAITKELCDELCLFDIFKDFAKAKEMDLSQMGILLASKTKVTLAEDYEAIKDSDIVVITAGKPRKDGMSRKDLLLSNAEIIKEVSEKIAEFSPEAVILVVTNPLDEMLYTAYRASSFERTKVLGMAGELDSARLIYNIAKLCDLEQEKIEAKVIGPHNDNMLVLKELITPDIGEKFAEVKELTVEGGTIITKLAKASAYYAPAAGIFKMIKAMQEDNDEILSCCVLNDDNLPFGRLVTLDKNGVKKISQYEIDTNGNNYEEIINTLKDNIKSIEQKLFEEA